jgi:hypothetical protein
MTFRMRVLNTYSTLEQMATSLTAYDELLTNSRKSSLPELNATANLRYLIQMTKNPLKIPSDHDNNMIKYLPGQSVFKLGADNTINLTAAEFERLSAACLAEIQHKFSQALARLNQRDLTRRALIIANVLT